MKTIPALIAIAALVAFVLVQFSFTTSVSLLFTAGFAAIMIADYTRVLRPVAHAAPATHVAALARERLGLAA